MKLSTLRTVTVTSAVSTLLIAASSAWAHDEHRRGERERFEYRHERYYRPLVVQRVQPVYGYAPQPVYYAPPPVYVPAPVYYQAAPVHYSQPAYYEAPRVSNAVLGTIGGAIAGAAIGNTIGRGNGRTAAIAIGAVTGAMIGGQVSR
jgi:hypothetical protein